MQAEHDEAKAAKLKVEELQRLEETHAKHIRMLEMSRDEVEKELQSMITDVNLYRNGTLPRQPDVKQLVDRLAHYTPFCQLASCGKTTLISRLDDRVRYSASYGRIIPVMSTMQTCRPVTSSSVATPSAVTSPGRMQLHCSSVSVHQALRCQVDVFRPVPRQTVKTSFPSSSETLAGPNP